MSKTLDDAGDWAEAFCKIANGFGFKDKDGNTIDEGWMTSWFADALVRGYDEAVKDFIEPSTS